MANHRGNRRGKPRAFLKSNPRDPKGLHWKKFIAATEAQDHTEDPGLPPLDHDEYLYLLGILQEALGVLGTP